MTLYRIRLELLSALVTPLKGDTIWGHIVWGIANHEGDEAVAEFLEQEKSGTPAMIVSSAFPAGMVCRALRPPEERKTENFGTKEYSEIKKKKKIIYENASEYFIDTTAPVNEVTEPPFKNIPVMHNTIDRSTNTVLERGLYSTEEKWPGKNIEWDLYILSTYAPERVTKLVKWAFENGYGADASTGKGRIDVKGGPVQVEPQKRGKHYMALGPFAEDPKNRLNNIRADIFVRSGKIGGAFASSLTPYKKPVALYDEGAVFDSDTEIEYAGVLLDNMHGEDNRICQSGFAPVIPVGA